MNKEKVALMIDAENVSFRIIDKLIKRVDSYLLDNPNKQLTHKLAFADWKASSNPEWEGVLKKNAIRQKHTPCYSKGKNGADISLVIYAMEAAFMKDIEVFILLTGDSDFTDLVYKLKEYGKTVIIAGDLDTAMSLKNAGNDFWELKMDKRTDPLPEKMNELITIEVDVNDKSNIRQKTKSQNGKQENKGLMKDKHILSRIAAEAYRNKKREKDSMVDMSVVYSEMLTIGKNHNVIIDYKALRYKKLKAFFVGLKIFKVIEIDKKTTITYMLKMNK